LSCWYWSCRRVGIASVAVSVFKLLAAVWVGFVCVGATGICLEAISVVAEVVVVVVVKAVGVGAIVYIV
jgi:hypothetical protein